MQSFRFSLYLYIMNCMRHLLLLALLGCATAVLAGETYAVIISGGRNKMYNHERYWNDCAFLYRTLRQTYHLSQDHITLLMADGDNPANDMLCDGATGFASSPTDLDGDGEQDLTLAATYQNLDDTFRWLSTMLAYNDRLFIFITDHGEQDDEGDIHLWLWGSEKLSPQELAMMVNRCHPATMNILLGQCYAGAFVASLRGEGRIITAVCAADQMSWACKDRPYDEFVYHWTCAIAQHDEHDQPVSSDANGDGCITMQEAYNYARQHDCRPETSILTALPSILATQWVFSDVEIENGIIPPSVSSTSTLYDLQGRKVRKK